MNKLTRRDFLRNSGSLLAIPVYIAIERLDKIYIPKLWLSSNSLCYIKYFESTNGFATFADCFLNGFTSVNFDGTGKILTKDGWVYLNNETLFISA